MKEKQSTRHLLMIEPAAFYANPETMETNVYQVDDEGLSEDELFGRALGEFRGFRDLLIENGVVITTVKGFRDCPDMVFPNWFSTHLDGRLVIYPMLADNRRAERAPFLIDILRQSYKEIVDLTDQEEENLSLEATGSMVLDRVNKVAYSTLSPRTSKEAALNWAKIKGYELHLFETVSHTGKPVYHTDLVMNIGTTLAIVCADCIVEEYRADVLAALGKTHTVMELSMEQLQLFCGNVLEVLGDDDARMLAMSSAAYAAFSTEQLSVIEQHYERIIHAPLPTLEMYGGGSARCCLAELF